MWKLRQANTGQLLHVRNPVCNKASRVGFCEILGSGGREGISPWPCGSDGQTVLSTKPPRRAPQQRPVIPSKLLVSYLRMDSQMIALCLTGISPGPRTKNEVRNCRFVIFLDTYPVAVMTRLCQTVQLNPKKVTRMPATKCQPLPKTGLAVTPFLKSLQRVFFFSSPPEYSNNLKYIRHVQSCF